MFLISGNGITLPVLYSKSVTKIIKRIIVIEA